MSSEIIANAQSIAPVMVASLTGLLFALVAVSREIRKWREHSTKKITTSPSRACNWARILAIGRFLLILASLFILAFIAATEGRQPVNNLNLVTCLMAVGAVIVSQRHND